jgi:hypothetical protein
VQNVRRKKDLHLDSCSESAGCFEPKSDGKIDNIIDVKMTAKKHVYPTDASQRSRHITNVHPHPGRIK